MPKVSIIVIIYKVSEYLSECLESITSQTYDNIEIICVVGKGDSKCEEISKSYAAKDSRIKLIIEEPKGTAAARNSGLDAVTGDYIAFVDGDDKIECDMIETMVRDIQAENADIAVVGKYDYYKNVIEGGTGGITEIYTIDRAFERILYNDKFFLHLWDKLYKKELFDGLKFDTGKQVEDRQMAVKILSRALKLVYDPTPKYYFRVSSDSGSRVENNLRLSLEADKKICEFLRCEYPEAEYPYIEQAIKYFLMIENMSVLQNSFIYNIYSKQHDREYIEYIRSHIGEASRLENMSKSLKIKMFLAAYIPGLLKYLTIKRKNAFVQNHIEFTSGTDWNSEFKKLGNVK